MDVLLLDNKMAEKLAQADAPVSLCNTHGVIVGYFTPAKEKRLFDDVSDEELDRRAKEPGRPLAAILADLEKRR